MIEWAPRFYDMRFSVELTTAWEKLVDAGFPPDAATTVILRRRMGEPTLDYAFADAMLALIDNGCEDEVPRLLDRWPEVDRKLLAEAGVPT